VRNNTATEEVSATSDPLAGKVSSLLKRFEETAAKSAEENKRLSMRLPNKESIALTNSGYHDSMSAMNQSTGYHETVAGHEDAASDQDSDEETPDDELDVLSHVKGYAASDFDDLLGPDVESNPKKFQDGSPLTSPRLSETPKTITTKLINEFKNRDWSAEYHGLLAQIGHEHAQPEEDFEKICQLVMTLNDLAEDFLTAAEVSFCGSLTQARNF
jgi:hypothetical protein